MRRCVAPAAQPGKRQPILVLLGLGVLLFAGYAIALHGRGLGPRKTVWLLGERSQAPNAPAAFRLVGWDLERDRPLPLTRVDLILRRAPLPESALARLLPADSVVDLNVKIPGWPRGPATLRAEVETELGGSVLEAEVWLDPSFASRLQLVPPSVELDRPPVLLQQGPGLQREPGSGAAGNAPAGLVFFPSGGRLSLTFKTRVWVRALDREGRAASGGLQVDQGPRQEADREGFVEVVMEGKAPQRLQLDFEGPGGRLSGEAFLVGTPTPVDSAADRVLLEAGQPVGIHLRSLSKSKTLYLDAWWEGGWCWAGQAQAAHGRVEAKLFVPEGVEGALVIRTRTDPLGRSEETRDLTVLVGRDQVPTLEEGLALLQRLPAPSAFWHQLGDPTPTIRTLSAVLSRVRAPEGRLLELADSRRSEEQTLTSRREDLVEFGRSVAAVVSGLAWVVAGWWLLAAARKAPKPRRKRSLFIALVGLGTVGLVLAAGWVGLLWVTG